MKIFTLCLLIGLSLSYNTTNAIHYARLNCIEHAGPYNPDDYRIKGQQCARYISQCLRAGGQDFNGCSGIDSKGNFLKVVDLRRCLTLKGWKSKKGLPKQFKAGYPFFIENSHAMLATYLKGKNITFCSNSPDRCDYKTTDKSFIYYYL